MALRVCQYRVCSCHSVALATCWTRAIGRPSVRCALAALTAGCIDFSTSDNNGLQAIVAQLAASHAPFSSIISLADYWVLAATLAIQYASTVPAAGSRGLAAPAAPLVLPFAYGRVTAPTCAGLDAGRLPSASFTWAQSAALFGAKGLSIPEVVALFGAHALGRAEFANSGFDGGWTTTQSSFSTSYFSRMLGAPWNNRNITANSNLWLNGGGGAAPSTLLLRSDVELAIAPANACPAFGGGAFRPSTGCPFNAITQNSAA